MLIGLHSGWFGTALLPDNSDCSQQLMAKNDMEGCKSHIHSAMEAEAKK